MFNIAMLNNQKVDEIDVLQSGNTLPTDSEHLSSDGLAHFGDGHVGGLENR